VTGRELEYLRRCLDSGWLSSAGPMVDEFEQRLATLAGRRHAVAVASGTAALHLGLLAAGVRPGDLVLTQSFSFVATANAVALAGATPLFVDSDPATWNMSATSLESVLEGLERRGNTLVHAPTGKRVAAVLPALILSLTGDIGTLEQIADRYGLPLVVDAAEALAARHGGRAAESYGDISCLSFNGNKVMTTGSGGAVLTDDADLATLCRHLSTQAKADGLDHVHDLPAFNYRMAAVNAAIGLAQLDALPEMLDAKQRISERYRAAFSDQAGIDCMPVSDPDRPWLFSVLVDDGRSAVERLNAAGIGARRLWRPLHRQPPYADCPRQEGGLDVADRLYAEGLSLPSSVRLTEEEQKTVIAALMSAMSGTVTDGCLISGKNP
jgi:perosamine synthetase